MSFLPFNQPRESDEAALADEVETWVNGELAELRASRYPDVLAPWLVVNRLAHASPATLRHVADDEPARSSPLRRHPTWAAAERGLVRQLLQDARPEDVVRLQRTALVPAELQLIETSSQERLTLGQAVAAAAKALAG